MRGTRRAVGVLAGLLALGGGTAIAHADTIRVQSTTDTVDAGLVDGLLRNAYKSVQPGDELAYTAVGTGKALDNAKAGLADVVITHAPSLEQQFVAGGYSLETPFGRQIFSSDYVLVGPKDDPAGVAAADRHDAIGAFEAIARAGADGRADFVSRGDNSGTNVQEQTMWGLTGDGVQKQAASNAAGAGGRDEPGTGGTLPAWYQKTNKGQAANLQEADVCATSSHPSGKCYTLVDRGTFNRLVNSGTVTRLQVVSDQNDASARGGVNLLINPFSVYVVSPTAPIPADAQRPNVAAAQRFVSFLVSPDFQAAVANFPTPADPAFKPDATAAATLLAPLPPAVAAGTPIGISVQTTNLLPGSPTLAGMPVQLQVSYDGGASWADEGLPHDTNAAGQVLLPTTVTRTTSYRVALPRFQALTAGTRVLGGVSAVPAPATPAGGGTVADRTAPRVTKLALSRRSVTLRSSEAATVRLTLARRVSGRFRTVKSVTVRATRAGSATRRFARIPTGTYRVTVRATDRAGNVATRTVRPRVR